MSDYDSNLLQEQSSSELKKESLAEMAGFIPEEIEVELNQSDEFIEVSELSTKGNFWDRAGLRTVAVAGIVFLGVLIFGLMTKTLTTAISSSNKQEAPKIAVQPKQVKEEKEDIGALKTNSAIGSQKAELQKLNSTILASNPSPAPVATATPSPAPTARSSTAIANSVIPTSATTIKPTPQPRAVSVPKVATVTVKSRPAFAYEPTFNDNSAQKQITLPSKKIKTASNTTGIKQSQNLQLPLAQPKPQVQAGKTQPQLNTETAKAIDLTGTDPNATWQAAASAGTYTASEESDTSRANSETEQQQSATQPVSSKSGEGEHNNGHNLIVGTRASGILETSITWTGNSNYQQSYLIKLTEELKNADGTIIIPKEALVVARIKSVVPEGWLEMSAISIVISSKEGIVEKPVPEEAILVQAENGSPLKAEYKLISATGTTDASSSRARALRRALKKNSKEANNQGNKLDSTLDFRTLTLNKGSSVQIYVNRSFSL